jgi:hypothetical protein
MLIGVESQICSKNKSAGKLPGCRGLCKGFMNQVGSSCLAGIGKCRLGMLKTGAGRPFIGG